MRTADDATGARGIKRLVRMLTPPLRSITREYGSDSFICNSVALALEDASFEYAAGSGLFPPYTVLSRLPALRFTSTFCDEVGEEQSLDHVGAMTPARTVGAVSNYEPASSQEGKQQVQANKYLNSVFSGSGNLYLQDC